MSKRKSHLPGILGACAVVMTLALGSNAWAQKNAAPSNEPPYYTGDTPIFNPFPDVIDLRSKQTNKKPWLVKNLGPVGIGIMLTRPGMTMQINNVEKGSPAEATGKLEKGQIIESINGKVLKDIDPRIILGDIVTEAEAKDGKVVLKIQGKGDVLVQIPVMGAYSKTWPLNCPKSDKIVRNLANLIAKQDQPKWGSVIFLLSTGEEKDLAVVRKWMKDIKTIGGLNWHKGYMGPGLCEYYLRTGDQSVLPVIKQMTEELKVHMYSGGWSGRGAPAAFTYSTGTGQLHAAGVHCMTFLIMAKLCGVEVDKYMFDKTFQQFYRFAGHGNVPYGNGPPEGGFRDNGKTGGLALAMEAAALVSPEGQSSVYAKARDNSAMKSFYATNWFHAAHTGGGMGEIWHHTAVSQMREKRPVAYRSFLDTRRWVMDLSRRYDGSIGIAGMDDRYDVSSSESDMDFGTFFALTYTLPRKQLQLFGAPRSKWAKTSPLPRPWGNLADDQFQSIEPIAGGPLTMQDLLNEKVETHASLAVIGKMEDPAMTDETLFKYMHHPEYDLRGGAMRQVVARGRVELLVPLLKSDDARLRQAGLLAITGMFKGSAIPQDQVTPEMLTLIGNMIHEPKESWWVLQHAVEALAKSTPEEIAKHRDRLIELLATDCDWIQVASVCALSKIAADPAHCKIVLPAILKTTADFRVDSASGRSTRAIADAMKTASPEVKAIADHMIKKTFASMPGILQEPNTGAVMTNGAKTVRSRVGSILMQMPGGEDYVRKTPKTTLASYISKKDSDMYAYKGTFIPNKSMIGTWAWCIYPQPNKPQDVEPLIMAWVRPAKGTAPMVIDKPKDVIQLIDGGKVGKSKFFGGYFWSDNMLIGVNDDQALKMEVKTFEGRDFLIIERGGFTPPITSDGLEEIPKDFHCGYHVYVRQ